MEINGRTAAEVTRGTKGPGQDMMGESGIRREAKLLWLVGRQTWIRV